MARRRKLTPERKEMLRGLRESYDPQSAQDVQSMLRDLLGDMLQEMLEAEMDDHLGYSKYDYKNKETDDSRNGYSPKTVVSSVGEINLDIPRDRKAEFEPKFVQEHQTDISNIEDQVLSMYAKGMTTRDISAHLHDVYGVDASAEMISHMTDRILPIAKEWQNRPLERKYAIVFMDAVHFYVREDNRTVKKAVYVAIGTKLSGQREVLGMWIGGNESAKYWLGVLNEIKNRGVEDIMVVSVDGLTGFGDAIHAVFPQAEIQRCIVDAITPIFKFSSDVRTVIYTTNAIESLNATYRKLNRQRSVFPSDQALLKALYLSTFEATKKWTVQIRNWGKVYGELSIMYEGRMPE